MDFQHYALIGIDLIKWLVPIRRDLGYKVPLLSVLSEELPDIQYFMIDEMVYLEERCESWWKDIIPYEYMYDQNGEEVEYIVTGHLYQLDWKTLIKTPETYSRLVAALESPKSPFMSEYNAIRQLLINLTERNKEDQSKKDIFERMF